MPYTLKQVLSHRVFNWGELTAADQELVRAAIEARSMVPNGAVARTNYAVGAAGREAQTGALFRGFNAEGVLVGPDSWHAEFAAALIMFVSLVLSSKITRPKFEAIAIALAPQRTNIICPPIRRGPHLTSAWRVKRFLCGHCLAGHQRFFRKSTRLLAVQANGQILVTTYRQALPLQYEMER